jgi:DNA-binding MarR family transcriptional regulator
VKNKFEFSPEEVAGLKKFMRTIAHFKKLEQSFPQSYMEALLHIALKPGLGTSDYAERIETSKSNASRILGILGERPRRSDEHHDLIEQEDDPRDARKTHYFLTAKGYSILKKILEEQA